MTTVRDCYYCVVLVPEDVGDYECVLNLHSGQSYNRTVSLLGKLILCITIWTWDFGCL